MNEVERSSQVSALFDGELDPTQSDLVTRRLLREPTLRVSWGRYALIGSCLRGEPLSLAGPTREDVAARVRARVEREAQLAPPLEPLAPARRRTGASARTLALGSALAAGVAAVAILILRLQSQATSTELAASAGAPAALPPALAPRGGAVPSVHSQLASRDTPAPSYTTPLEQASSGVRLAAPLVNYVVAHSEYTTPVARFSPLSSVMTSNLDPTENTVEMTEAEVGARR